MGGFFGQKQVRLGGGGVRSKAVKCFCYQRARRVRSCQMVKVAGGADSERGTRIISASGAVNSVAQERVGESLKGLALCFAIKIYFHGQQKQRTRELLIVKERERGGERD